MSRDLRSFEPIAVFSVAVLMVAASASVPAMAANQPTSSFTVDLEADGSALVTVTFVYDLTDEDERAAFEALADDADAREGAKLRFTDRLNSIATDVEEATGREMDIKDPQIDITTTGDGETGVISLSVTWISLAGQDGDRLILGEPFASGFSTDRKLIVNAPNGYAITAVSPTPDDRTTETVEWTAGTTFDDFRVVAAPADSTHTTASPMEQTEADGGAATETSGQAGFGAIVAVLAILATMIAVHRRGNYER